MSFQLHIQIPALNSWGETEFVYKPSLTHIFWPKWTVSRDAVSPSMCRLIMVYTEDNNK